MGNTIVWSPTTINIAHVRSTAANPQPNPPRIPLRSHYWQRSLKISPDKREDTMAVRVSSAEWKGTLKEGAGTLKLASGAYEGPFTYASRFESGKGTNPEELIGAAHA